MLSCAVKLCPAGKATLTRYLTNSRPPAVVMRPLVYERPFAFAMPSMAQPLPEPPLVVNPLLAKPLIAKPFIANPFVAKPFVAKPLVVNPFIAKPLVVNPFAVKPLVANPLMAKPLLANPLVAKPFSDATAEVSPPTSSICSEQPTIPTIAPNERPTVSPNLIVRFAEAFMFVFPFSVAQPTARVPLALRRPIARGLLLSQGFDSPTCKNQSSNRANSFLNATNVFSGTWQGGWGSRC